MKQQEKLNELIEVWDNSEKAQAIKALKSSMSESKPTRASTQEVGDYVKHALKESLQGRNIPDYTSEDVSSASRSSYYKKAIEAAAQEIEGILYINTNNKVLKSIWENCKDSSNLVDFRKNLKLYLIALMTELYTEEDVQELTDMVDSLDRENRRLREYERVYNEIFDVLQKGDEDFCTYQKYKALKEKGMTDREVSKVLRVSRPKLSNLCKDFDYSGE